MSLSLESDFFDCRRFGDRIKTDGLFEIREPAWQSSPLRALIEDQIERLIAFLDRIDGDPDLEDTHDAEQSYTGC